jgi:LysR family transcriptional regulator, nitrogen assimilation regulatory protein
MDFRKLTQFLAVVEAGSLSAAAERLHIAQPALTHAIKTLEAELGVALFERHARGVTITDLGRALAGQATRILREVERTKVLIRTRAQNPAGNVRIAAPALFPPGLIPRLYRRVAARHSEIELTVLERDAAAAEQAVRTGDCDLALTYASAVSSDVLLRPLLVDELAAVLPPQLADSERIAGIPDLVGLRLVLPPAEDPIRAILNDAALRHAARLQVSIEVSSREDFAAFVTAGNASVLPSSIAIAIAKHAGGRVSMLAQPRMPCGLSLVAPQNRPPTRSVSICVEELMRSLDELIDEQGWPSRYVGGYTTGQATITLATNSP